MTHPLYEKDDELKKTMVSKGTEKTVTGVASESISILTKKGEDKKKYKVNIEMEKTIKAPIKAGDQIGTLKVTKDGKTLVKSPVVAEKSIDQASWWQLFKKSMGMFTHGGS